MKQENAKLDLKQTGQKLVVWNQIITKEVKKYYSLHRTPD